MADARAEFLEVVLSNSHNRAILENAGVLGLSDWWLTGGAIFQTVWNVLEGRPADQGILDYDLFYFDAEKLTAEAEASVNRAAAALFREREIVIEARNEARVHLWYEEEFGVPGRRFESTRDAIDHFAAITCCFAVTRRDDGELKVYAPHGFDDLLQRRVRPNPVLVPREVYETKARRWSTEWPLLTVEAWPTAPHLPGE